MSVPIDKGSGGIYPRVSISTLKPGLNLISSNLLEAVVVFELSTLQDNVLDKRVDYLCGYFIFCHRESQNRKYNLKELFEGL